MIPEVPESLRIFLGPERKLLLVLHAVGAAALLGLATHSAVWSIEAWLRRGKGGWSRQEGRFARWTLWVFLLTYALGALDYPSYTIYARALRLDPHEPFVARLFDVKENVATLALGLVAARAWIRRRIDPGGSPAAAPFYVGMTLLAALFIWGAFLLGVVVVSHASV